MGENPENVAADKYLYRDMGTARGRAQAMQGLIDLARELGEGKVASFRIILVNPHTPAPFQASFADPNTKIKVERDGRYRMMVEYKQG